MRPFWLVLLAVGLLCRPVGAAEALGDSPILSARDSEIYRAAFQAAHALRWTEARSLAAEGQDPLLAKTLQWYVLLRPEGNASFDEIASFIASNPDWPSLNALRERAEDALPDHTSAGRVREWFEQYPPVSTTGRIRYAEALLAAAERQKGIELLRKTWIEGNFGERQEQIFLFRHTQQLRPEDHLARLDRLLWDGQTRAARTMLHRVDAGHAALAEARLRMQATSPSLKSLRLTRMAGGIDAVLRRVPAELQNDPGILFDRLRWYRLKGQDAEARAILMNPPADLVRPDLWWQERSLQVHNLLAHGQASEALQLTEQHGQPPGSAGYADAEWLAGWIALRFLREPEQALTHFGALGEAVRYPVTRSRIAYWQGRALEAMGNSRDAADLYTAAARYGMTYYGQLATLRLDPAARPSLPSPPQPRAFQREAFDQRELVRVVRELGAIGEENLQEVFIRRLAAVSGSPEEAELVADLTIEQTRPDFAVRLARHTLHDEVSRPELGYPLRPLPDAAAPERALVLAVIRQESSFDARAISPSGALGLMQLMPITARRTASGLGLRYVSSRLTGDPDYNVQLGSAYLASLLNDFGGNYALAIAAYNAGPGRVRQWMHDNGDPRSPKVDVVDWVELIPRDETRNYVQRVLEALHIYRERLAGTVVDLSLERDLRGSRLTP